MPCISSRKTLAYRLTAKGKQLSVSTREKYLCSGSRLCPVSLCNGLSYADLSKTITLPKQPKRLPKVILEYVEITKIMAAPDMRTHAGYRNRIILEILYDTGIRAAEMAAVKTGDLDIVHGYLTIRSAQGNKRPCRTDKLTGVRYNKAVSSHGPTGHEPGKGNRVSGAQSLGNEDDTHRRLGHR
ncbi:MAG: tyrosine-type recombinase/integrase [Desulfofustis sp. PB-SRB1]|nr:tyrosine-type recombinase/integrase [Desulfofustis sp. PB-SRB1]